MTLKLTLKLALRRPRSSFANRHTSDFIKPEEVDVLESWAGEAVLQTMVGSIKLEVGLHEACRPASSRR